VAIRSLYLVRHGQPVTEIVDPERPLSDTGHAQIKKLAAVLADITGEVDLICHSGLKRSEETAEILAAAVRPRSGVRWCPGLKPEDPPARFLADLEAEDFQRVMVAGHLPFLGRLSSLLLTGQEQPEVVGFSMGAAAFLELAEGSAQWTLRWMIDPTIAKR
jgi:phosphohistidine phosphatase